MLSVTNFMKEHFLAEKKRKREIFGLALIINKHLGNHEIEFPLIGGLQN